MAADLRYPSLYQITTSVCLTKLSRALCEPATLDDIPDSELIDSSILSESHHDEAL
jgi:hypothetical protein